MKNIMFLLGLCNGYVPNDIPLSDQLCLGQIEAGSRAIQPDYYYDDFQAVYFTWQIAQVTGG